MGNHICSYFNTTETFYNLKSGKRKTEDRTEEWTESSCNLPVTETDRLTEDKAKDVTTYHRTNRRPFKSSYTNHNQTTDNDVWTKLHCVSKKSSPFCFSQ